MHLWRAILLLSILTTTIFSVNPIDLTFAVPAIAIIVGMFLALSNMLATTTSDPRLQAWTKTEMQEFVGAIILVVGITAVFMGVGGLGSPIATTLTGDADHINSSITIVDSWIANYNSAFKSMIAAATKIRAAATYSPYMNIPLWYVSISYSTAPISGIGILLGPINMAGNSLANVIFMAEGLRMIILLMQTTIPKIILPLAFCLRIIPFSRKLGNTLIALSLAGMVLLPFSVILTNALNNTIDYPTPTIDVSKLDAKPAAMMMMEPLCESKVVRTILLANDVIFSLIVCLPLLLSGVGAVYYPVCYNLMKEVIYPLLQTLFQLTVTAIMIIWEASFNGALRDMYLDNVFNALQPFLANVSNLIFLSYLDFALIVIITYTGARSISTALGGEWYMAGIQRLV